MKCKTAFNSRINLGEQNGMWKGDAVSIHSLHKWIKRRVPKPQRCSECKKKTEFLDLANISGKYKRDVKDFEWLCRRCHMQSDGRMKKLLEMQQKTALKRRRKHKNELIQCTRCKEFKIPGAFSIKKYNWDNRNMSCKDCNNAKQRHDYRIKRSGFANAVN